MRLRRFELETPGVEIYAKAEWQNPGGSVKDRAAARMVADGEASGGLRPGLTIVDATSGNTGIAYAMVGAARGYHVKLCSRQCQSGTQAHICARLASSSS